MPRERWEISLPLRSEETFRKPQKLGKIRTKQEMFVKKRLLNSVMYKKSN